MRRRTVLGLLGCVMMWPRVTGAQTAPAKRLGVIIQGGPDYAALTGLREGLRAAGGKGSRIPGIQCHRRLRHFRRAGGDAGDLPHPDCIHRRC